MPSNRAKSLNFTLLGYRSGFDDCLDVQSGIAASVDARQ